MLPLTGLRATWLLLLAPLGGCMVLSHDTYFSPTSSAEHELRSPFPGNPWNSFPMFGSPSDIITVDLRTLRLGLSVRNSATSMAWVGPVFLPVIPIPAGETLETSQLRVWIAIAPRSDVGVLLSQVRLRLPDESVDIPPAGIYRHAVAEIDAASIHETQRVAGGDAATWYLEFTLPGPVGPTSFELHVAGITTPEGPLAPVRVEFSKLRGWRALSLP